jgi:hypothetical protein
MENEAAFVAALEAGMVSVTFTSLISGTEITEEFTLRGVHLPTPNPTSDKIVLLRTSTALYEDIQKDSIISWQAPDEP